MRRFACALVAAAALVARAEESPPLEGAWDLRLVFKGQKPDSEHARLLLTKAGDAWGGSISFERNFGGNKLPLVELAVEGTSFRFICGGSGLQMEGRLDKTVLVGKWTGVNAQGAPFEIPWTGVRAVVEAVARFDRGLTFDAFVPQAKAEDLGMDGEALDELIREAARTDTDALIVLRDGKVVAERYFGRGGVDKLMPAPTQFVAAFAAALLVEENKVPSFDAPLSTWFADWKEGRKAAVTLRKLLTRTSGLDHADVAKLRAARDQVALARGLPVSDVSGEPWTSGDEAAVQLVSGVLGKAAGRPVDDFLRERLFAPLGIKKADWKRDGAGNTVAWEGLSLSARDLARIGRLVANDGDAAGTRVLSRESLTALGSPVAKDPPADAVGLLWELFRPYPKTPHTGVVGRAPHGQWIVVFPNAQTVGVRLRARKGAADDAKTGLSFEEFAKRLSNALR